MHSTKERVCREKVDPAKQQERLICSRLLELLQDFSVAMNELEAHKPAPIMFRAEFRPDTNQSGETVRINYFGSFLIEGKGKRLKRYFPRDTDEYQRARTDWSPVVSLRPFPRMLDMPVVVVKPSTEEKAEKVVSPPVQEKLPPISQFDEILATSATCTIGAQALVHPAFRESVRRFMRDYFVDDSIRFFNVTSPKGVLLTPWAIGNR